MPHRLVELALDLTGSLGEEDRYRRILAALREHVGADAANLLRYEAGVLSSIVADGLAPGTARRLHVDAYPVLGRILESDGPHRITDPEGIVSEIAYDSDTPAAGKPLAVLVGVPLRVEGQLVGLLTFSSSRAGAFDGVHDEAVELYAALAAASMRTADLIAALEGAATRSRQLARDLFAEQYVREAGPLLGESPVVRALRAQIEAVAEQLAAHELLKGKTIGVDATTLEANAAMRSLVRRDTGQSYQGFLEDLAKASGVETPTKGEHAQR